MNEISEFATYASVQTDRWLFIALLGVAMISIMVLFKFFTSRLDKLQAKMEDQTKDFLKHLQTNNSEMLVLIAQAQRTIAENTMLFKRIEENLRNLK